MDDTFDVKSLSSSFYWKDLDSSSHLMLDVVDRIESLAKKDTFYGLPSHLKDLISKYKGIDDLYGR